jgi:hypothetical protein
MDLPDRRRVYVRRDEYGWQRVELQDIEDGDFFAVVEDENLSPGDVSLYVAKNDAFRSESGRWTVPVETPDEVGKYLDRKD